MKAAALRKHGSVDQLEIMDLPVPKYGEKDVLIRVKAFALNRLDIWTRQGMSSLKIEFPHVGASDFAGIIEEMGSSVSDFAIGDRVVVNAGVSCNKCEPCKSGEPSLCEEFGVLGEHSWGGAAEYAVVPAKNILHIPEHIDFTTAAASALTAMTSYRMLVSRAGIRPGDFVLIIGSGGGIGTIATQIAHELGGRVLATTSSEEKVKLSHELGAELVINYHNQEDWGKKIWEYTGKRGVDIIIDSTGESVFKQAVRSLTKGGRYVTCGVTSGYRGDLNLALLFWKQLSILGSTMASHQEFREAMYLVFSKKIKPIIDSVYSLDQIKEAHRRLEDPEHIGKIVIEME